jgi:hypothetical protein
VIKNTRNGFIVEKNYIIIDIKILPEEEIMSSIFDASKYNKVVVSYGCGCGRRTHSAEGDVVVDYTVWLCLQ